MTHDIQITQPGGPQQGEIILYQPDETVRLEGLRVGGLCPGMVRLEDDTVWLTTSQMALLFDREESNIRRHILNVFSEDELERSNNVQNLHVNGVKKPVPFYSLDVIISVGYRVKSKRGTMFRQWANRVLREYLLRGYSVNSRIMTLERKVDEQASQLKQVRQTLDFFVQTSQPPVVGVFSGGQVFSARLFVEDLIKAAKQEIILVDNYVDAKTFDLLDVRVAGVRATIYTERVDASLQRLQQLHNQEHASLPVNIAAYTHPFHDRFLIIDDDLWHCGASFKDLGRRLFAIDRLNIDKSIILGQL